MLLTKAEIDTACSLDLAALKAALERGGYSAGDIRIAAFKGMNPNGTFVYEVTYPSSDDDSDGTGYVYVKYARAKFSLKFQLEADF